MITGRYYLMADDGFGRQVILDASGDASSLDNAFENHKSSKKYKAIYIIHVIQGTRDSL